MWQKELNKKQCQSIVGSQKITGMPFGTGLSDKVANMACDIAETELIIKGKLAEVQQQRKKIIDFINSVDDSFMRQIIFLRNVSCMSWEDVAREIGGNNKGESIKKKYYRYFEENKDVPECHDCM